MPLALGLVLLLGLLAALAAVAWKRGAMLREPALLLGAIVGGSAAAWIAVTLMGALRAGTDWRAHPEITFVAIYATVIFAAVAMLRTLGARSPTDKLRPAFWSLFLLIGGAIALIAPGVIIYFLFPPALVLAGVLLRRWWPPAETVGGLAALAALYVTWGEMLAQLEEIFSPGPLWIVAPLASLVVVAALVEAQPALSEARRSAVLGFAALLALLGWGAAAAAPAYSPDHQQRFTIEHVTDFGSGRSSWSILNDGASLPAGYSRLGPWKMGELPFSPRRRWLAAAPPIANVRPPSIEPIELLRHGDSRTIRLRLKANGAERIALIAPEDARIEAAGIEGFARSFKGAGSPGKFTMSCTGRSCEGAELRIEQASAKPIEFTLIGALGGLPQSAAPLVRLRPVNARPQYSPDEMIAVSRVKV
jgi:hypothetical protein